MKMRKTCQRIASLKGAQHKVFSKALTRKST